MGKISFAYLIMAHNNPEQLKILLSLLDFPENEIFVHIDKKNSDINAYELRSLVKKAKIKIYKKFAVYHGSITQTECQTYLLDEACKTYHDYYHLISNADLPIKTHEYIANFFKENFGKQFIHFESFEYCMKENNLYYHFLDLCIKKMHKSIIKKIIVHIERYSIALQKFIKIKRKFYCGANWYSITHDLATDFCENKKKLLKMVRWTVSSDELILQTFLKLVSKNNYSLYKLNKDDYDYEPLMRAIDWRRGSPYVWKYSDYDELISSNALYARKFDINIDRKIIEEIARYVSNK